ncbi:hypothetical protein SAMN03159312_4421 [Pseudomonas sp. NFIX49]|nr:hypothetical protein SAMN03159312_4421 [Pseudomonas sp. NFIX49]
MNTSEFGDAEETKDDLVQEPLPAGTVAPTSYCMRLPISNCRYAS